jgi:hypothetical protein
MPSYLPLCLEGSWWTHSLCVYPPSPRLRHHADALSVKHIPAWFPGAGFKKIAAQYKVWTKQAMEEPAAYVKESMVR